MVPKERVIMAVPFYTRLWTETKENGVTKLTSEALAMVTAEKGGITATDATQWGKFTADIENAGNDTIVLVMDRTPGDFTSAGETNYFRAVLGQYVAEGKTVFVISCYNQGYWTALKDGVRYINLPNLWKADGTVNENYTMLRFRVKDGAVSYEAVNIK